MFDPSALPITALLGLAAAGAFAALLDLANPSNWRHQDAWRDPAPPLFRLLLPLARLIAPHWPARNDKQSLWECRLARAGIGYSILPAELLALRWILAVIGSATAGLSASMAGLSGLHQGLSLGLGALLGHFYPVIWLRDAGHRRQRAIERHFPALLELLSLGVRAGLSFSAALNQATTHLPASPLRAECQRLSREIRTGSTRQDALSALAWRTGVTSVQGFVAAVIQADETGAPVSQVLSDQARQRRRERFAAAEKKANEAPVRMLLPLVGLLFPVTFLIIGFPIALQFMEGGL